ncbi:MAG: Aha1 protein [Brevundimonas sp.]|nr:Aha1 protein [Brevundimonas sp.]
MNDAIRNAARAQFSIRRDYTASVEEAWDLWTTKAGIESWWGPEGFEVTVTALDLRAGGEMTYLMRAVAPEMVAFMKRSDMPVSTPCKVTYADVSARRRLSYNTLTDFVPGVEPYDVATVVEFQETAGGVAVNITFDAMHDDAWTERARAGHESQMRKLDALLAARTRESARDAPSRQHQRPASAPASG